MKILPPFIKDKYFTRDSLNRTLIFLIIFLSFLLAIYKSIPFESVDEHMIAKWIWGFHGNPFPVNQYPPLFLYLHFLLSLLYKSVFLLLGIVKTGYEFLYTGIGYKFMIEAGRYISAIFGMLMLYYIYRSGKESYNLNVAFASTLLIAFNGVFILHSHIFKSDILVSFLVSVSLFFLLRYLDNSRRNWLFLASFFFGLSFAAKYNIAVFFLIILYAIFVRRKELGFFRGVFIFITGAFSGFIISSPNWIVNPIGNIKRLLHVYNFNEGSVYIQDLSPFSIYMNFITDIKDQFGVILTVVLIIGIVLSFMRKNKKDMLLSLFLIIYILFFGLTGFYGRRFLLPIYPVLAILIAKTLFVDFFDLLKLKKRSENFLKILVFLPVIYLSIGSSFNIIKKFNMLNLESKNKSSLKYRQEHNLNNRKYLFGSQVMTPKRKGDVRFRKKLEINRVFRKRGKPDLIQVNAWSLKKLADFKDLNDPDHIDISNFRVFHKIERRMIQDWDIDIHFLYRISKELRDVESTYLNIELPKMYSGNGGDFFYPDQRYEKSKGFMRSKSGYCSAMAFSEKDITSFRIRIFSIGLLPEMKVRINGQEGTLKGLDRKEVVNEIRIENVPESSLYFGSVYSIEVYPADKLLSAKFPVYYVVFEPENEQKMFYENDYRLNQEFSGGIPEIFSGEKYREWIIKMYHDTSVDLPLYDLVNTMILEKDPITSRFFEESLIFPLDPGDYLITLFTEPLTGNYSANEDAVVQYDVFSSKGKDSGNIRIREIGKNLYPFTINMDNDLVFVRLKFVNFRKNNLLLKSAAIKPDLIKYIQKKYMN
ncbi:MAG: glycosyltransferase family 39 protein [Candidatus Aminicenantes bacterium]|nr:glycosyltransferase family 39 protein [Candidatus Aminicenantes bacterium]